MNRIAVPLLTLGLLLASVLCWAAEPNATKRRRLPRSRRSVAR
jgi:hypothetical protein